MSGSDSGNDGPMEGDLAAVYDSMASSFAQHAEDGAYNAHYDRPSMIELCGDVAGKRVLDVGCGPGFYSEALIERGATVVACDASEPMIQLARQRLGMTAESDERPWASLSHSTTPLSISSFARS
jgi:2-polyprenyl-3-methyl-5-hydroxy-6-metoxy-1,4-benzoquinol methylase